MLRVFTRNVYETLFANSLMSVVGPPGCQNHQVQALHSNVVKWYPVKRPLKRGDLLVSPRFQTAFTAAAAVFSK